MGERRSDTSASELSATSSAVRCNTSSAASTLVAVSEALDSDAVDELDASVASAGAGGGRGESGDGAAPRTLPRADEPDVVVGSATLIVMERPAGRNGAATGGGVEMEDKVDDDVAAATTGVCALWAPPSGNCDGDSGIAGSAIDGVRA